MFQICEHCFDRIDTVEYYVDSNLGEVPDEFFCPDCAKKVHCAHCGEALSTVSFMRVEDPGNRKETQICMTCWNSP